MSNENEIQRLGSASSEIGSADFNDERLTKRLMMMCDALAADPTESLPKSLGEGAGIEGGYRFLRNSKVSVEKILAPHIENTAARAKVAGRVLAIHDTTEVKFSSERDGLGWLSSSKSKKNGFRAHISLVVSADGDQRPLGVIGVEFQIATGKEKGYLTPGQKKKDPTRKSLRWMRAVKSAAEKLGSAVDVIHVSDREADFFEYFSKLKDSRSQHVTRVCRDRNIDHESFAKGVSLYENLEKCAVRFRREVPLSARKTSPLPHNRKIHPARKQRLATLSVTATAAKLRRGHHNDWDLNELIDLNVVHVFEELVPEGEPAVDWKLFTTLPIDTNEQVETIVDYYRTRWLIEEYNKALKTGCSLEERQLESKATILNAFAIFIPIAWRMLLFRSEERKRPNAPAQVALTQSQIDVLKAISKKPMSQSPTVGEALAAVARLGGHLKQNGPPGWRILAKGLSELLTLEKGWLAAKRCDLS